MAKGTGHAEITGLNAAKDMGLTPTAIGVSRNMCDGCLKAVAKALWNVLF
jgi:hypothetical protein